MNRIFLIMLLAVSLIYAQESTNIDENKSEENLRLMYQVFTYSSDLKNAYKIAQNALLKNPNSIFWNEKMVEIARWTDRRPQAMKSYFFLYNKTKDKELKKEILQYALDTYQYKIAAPIVKDDVLESPNKKNINDMVYLYDQVGTPEVAAALLMELSNRPNAQPTWLTKALEIYRELGEEQKVQKILEKLDSQESLDLNMSKTISSYYISQKNIPKAYQTLLRAKITQEDKNITEYHKLLSDIGWYLGDTQNAVQASLGLYKSSEARMVDIDRILFVYGDSNVSAPLIEETARYGYAKFRLINFYQKYLDTLYREKKYAVLADEFHKAQKDQNISSIFLSSYVNIMMGETYANLGDTNKAIVVYRNTLNLKEISSQERRYLLELYFNALNNQKEYQTIIDEFNRIEKSNSGDEAVLHTGYFLLMRGFAYSAMGDKTRAEALFKEALKVENNSVDYVANLLWFYIDNEEHKSLRDFLFLIEDAPNIDESLWLPLTAAQFALQRIDRARYYIEKLMKSKNIQKDSNVAIDIQFTYAFILQSQEEQDGFMQIMQNIYNTLRHQLMQESSLLQNKEFMKKYLSAAPFFMNADQYIDLLESSKTLIGKEKYVELAIYWNLMNHEHEKARYLSVKLSKIEPWMQLSIALNDHDNNKILDLLHKFYPILPLRDRVDATQRTGNYSLGDTLAFEGLEQNSYDYLLYKQRRDSIEDRSDRVTAENGDITRKSLDRTYLELSGQYYIAKAWTLLSNVKMAMNRNKDFKNLRNIPRNDNSAQVGLQKEFDRGLANVLFGFRRAVEAYATVETDLQYKIMSRLNLNIQAYYGKDTQESTYLMLGGKKHGIKTNIRFDYMPSTNLSVSFAYDEFYSQDDYNLGNGYYARAEIYNQIHNGYPDMSLSLFVDYGYYNDEFVKTFGKNFDDITQDSSSVLGSLGALMPYGGRVLPEVFYNIGATLAYGSANNLYYTRVWRPFFQATPYYSGGAANSFQISVGGGLGGKLNTNDHLVTGASYTQSINGIQEGEMKLYLNYKFFY